MCRRCFVFLVFPFLLLPGLVWGQSPPTGPFAYVTNQSSNNVSVIDTSTNTVVATIDLRICTGEGEFLTCDSPGPAGIAITPDAKHAYVADELIGAVSVIDTSMNTVSSTRINIPCPPDGGSCSKSPVGVGITPDGRFVYVTNTNGHFISVIGTSTNTVTATITQGVSGSPFGIAITPDGAFAYVANGPLANTVSVISTAGNMVVATVALQGTTGNPTGVAVHPSGFFAYVSVSTSTETTPSGNVQVIRTSDNTVVGSPIPVGGGPSSVAFTPNGAFAYVTNEGAGTVSVIKTANNSVVSTVTVGSLPTQVAITPDGTLAYATNAGSSTVSVINTTNNTTQSPVTVGTAPFGVAITPVQPISSTTIEQTLQNFPATNVFDFVTHKFKVSYPSGTPSFTPSGIIMSVTADVFPPGSVESRFAPQFANGKCVNYTLGLGLLGRTCTVYTVICEDPTTDARVPCPFTNGFNPFASPPVPHNASDILVYTGYSTTDTITNPGFLKAVANLFNQDPLIDFYPASIDPGDTDGSNGFSQWVAVNFKIDANTSPTTAADFSPGFLPPLAPKNDRVFGSGDTLAVKFQITGLVPCNGSNAGACFDPTQVVARISVQIGSTRQSTTGANLKSIPNNQFVFDPKSGTFQFYLSLSGYASGLYNLIVTSNSFQVATTTFTIP